MLPPESKVTFPSLKDGGKRGGGILNIEKRMHKCMKATKNNNEFSNWGIFWMVNSGSQT